MSVIRPVSYTLLVPLLVMPAAVGAMGGIDDLDVTIRVIDRQDRDIDAFINRIELPAPETRDTGIDSRRGDQDPGDRGEDNRRGRDDADDRSSERSRDAGRDGDGRRNDEFHRSTSVRGETGGRFREQRLEDRREGNYRNRDDFRRQQSELRNEIGDPQRRFRGD